MIKIKNRVNNYCFIASYTVNIDIDIKNQFQELLQPQ